MSNPEDYDKGLLSESELNEIVEEYIENHPEYFKPPFEDVNLDSWEDSEGNSNNENNQN